MNLLYELLWIVPVHHIGFEDAAQADHDADPPVLPDGEGPVRRGRAGGGEGATVHGH